MAESWSSLASKLETLYKSGVPRVYHGEADIPENRVRSFDSAALKSVRAWFIRARKLALRAGSAADVRELDRIHTKYIVRRGFKRTARRYEWADFAPVHEGPLRTRLQRGKDGRFHEYLVEGESSDGEEFIDPIEGRERFAKFVLRFKRFVQVMAEASRKARRTVPVEQSSPRSLPCWVPNWVVVRLNDRWSHEKLPKAVKARSNRSVDQRIRARKVGKQWQFRVEDVIRAYPDTEPKLRQWQRGEIRVPARSARTTGRTGRSNIVRPASASVGKPG